MAVVDSTILLAIALIASYLFLYKDHKIWCGILVIATGAASYLIVPTNNPYGVLIIAIGLITIFTAPWDKGK